MQDPLSRETFFPSIATAIREFRLFPPGKHFLLRKASLIVLACLCLGGFVFLIDRHFQPKPAQTSRSFQEVMEPISGSEAQPGPDELTPISPAPDSASPSDEPTPISPVPEPASPADASLVPVSEEDKRTRIITVKKGNTISSLTKKYYGMTNPTLMNFILDLNQEITDVNLILLDQRVKFPKITEELLATKSPDNNYRIQVGTFQTPDFIRFYVHEPTLKGKEVKIFPRKVSSKQTWYRVVVGPFGNKEECLRVIDRLKEKGLLPAFGGIVKME